MDDADASLFDEGDPAAEERAIARGLADIEAGRVIPHAQVAAWLDTWETPDEKPHPRVTGADVRIVAIRHGARGRG